MAVAGFIFAFGFTFVLLLFGALFVSVGMSMGMDFIRFSASAILAHIEPSCKYRTFLIDKTIKKAYHSLFSLSILRLGKIKIG
jgi:hypothetical protein